MAQQTAVEWLIQQVNSDCLNSTFINPQLIEQAKAMEKEQIEEAYLNGCFRVTPYGYYNDSAEQYYNETYGKKMRQL